MTKNPILNALTALGYIIIVANVMFYGMKNFKPANEVVFPIILLSMLTLSAAMMGYIFLSQPIQLYLDGKKKEAVKLFTQTLGIFAGITAVALTLLFSGIIKV